MRHCFLLLYLCLIPSFSKANNNALIEEQVLAEQILTNLFNSYGNFIYPIPPKIEIVTEKKRVAAFVANKQSGKIIIEQAAIDVCRKFGKDFESALAFIIGHELGHFYERQHNEGFATNYLKWSHDLQSEEKADVWGVFCAYLANYKTVKLVPNLMEALYVEYDLMGKDLYGYPTFEVRRQIATNVQYQVLELIHLFETANELSAVGKYELAATTYTYIEQFYQGREIYNNLGVNYALHAMNFTKKNVDKYFFPFEIDGETRLKKPQLDRGGEDLTKEEQAYRMKLLKKAKDYLEQAGKLDYNYLLDDINMMSVLNLMMDLCEDCERPLAYYENHELLKTAKFIGAPPTQIAQLKLALALSYAKTGKKEAAKNIWNDLKNSPNESIRYQAAFNLAASAEDYSTSFIKNYDCPTMEESFTDKVRFHRIEIQHGFPLNEITQLEIRQLANSTLSIFQQNNGDMFIVQKQKNTNKEKLIWTKKDNYRLVSRTNGSFVTCDATNQLWSFDQAGLLINRIKYYAK